MNIAISLVFAPNMVQIQGKWLYSSKYGLFLAKFLNIGPLYIVMVRFDNTTGVANVLRMTKLTYELEYLRKNDRVGFFWSKPFFGGGKNGNSQL